MMNLIFIAIVGVTGFGLGILYCAYFIGTRINSNCTEEEKVNFKELMKKVYD